MMRYASLLVLYSILGSPATIAPNLEPKLALKIQGLWVGRVNSQKEGGRTLVEVMHIVPRADIPINKASVWSGLEMGFVETKGWVQLDPSLPITLFDSKGKSSEKFATRYELNLGCNTAPHFEIETSKNEDHWNVALPTVTNQKWKQSSVEIVNVPTTRLADVEWSDLREGAKRYISSLHQVPLPSVTERGPPETTLKQIKGNSNLYFASLVIPLLTRFSPTETVKDVTSQHRIFEVGVSNHLFPAKEWNYPYTWNQSFVPNIGEFVAEPHRLMLTATKNFEYSRLLVLNPKGKILHHDFSMEDDCN